MKYICSQKVFNEINEYDLFVNKHTFINMSKIQESQKYNLFGQLHGSLSIS